jgi:hypothetical protein
MFFFSWRHTEKPAEGMRQDPAADELLLFEPSQIVLAIAFHLLDEGLAAAVDATSREAVTHALTELGVRLALPRQRWRMMDNGQRLRWLLTQAATEVAFGPDRIAILTIKEAPANRRSQARVTA